MYLNMSLRSIISSHDIMSSFVTPDISVPCVIRCCEVLAEIIHTHYLITQVSDSEREKAFESFKFEISAKRSSVKKYEVEYN